MSKLSDGYFFCLKEEADRWVGVGAGSGWVGLFRQIAFYSHSRGSIVTGVSFQI